MKCTLPSPTKPPKTISIVSLGEGENILKESYKHSYEKYSQNGIVDDERN